MKQPGVSVEFSAERGVFQKFLNFFKEKFADSVFCVYLCSDIVN